MKTKRKYIHVEVIDRTLYIYADDTSWGGKTLTLKDMDIKCEVSEQGKKIHVKIPLEDFVK